MGEQLSEANLKPSCDQAARAWKHGHASHIRGETPTYRSWQAMRTRCRNLERDVDKKHAGRGIRVCREWESSFERFLADMGPRPAGMTLDREDNDGDYTPSNCRWATPRQQARNTRRNRLTFNSAVEVAVARLGGERCKSIAARFGISESLPREIVRGRCWPDALEAARKLVETRNVS